jgi:hypothetical protein
MEHLNANSSLSGYPAYYVDYTYTVPSPQGILQLKNLQTWTIAGYKAYSFTFGAQPLEFASYMPTIDKVIDSFEIRLISRQITTNLSRSQDNLFLD